VIRTSAGMVEEIVGTGVHPPLLCTPVAAAAFVFQAEKISRGMNGAISSPIPIVTRIILRIWILLFESLRVAGARRHLLDPRQSLRAELRLTVALTKDLPNCPDGIVRQFLPAHPRARPFR